MFKIKTFKGGLHPHDMKFISQDSAIKEMPCPETLIIPLSQHVGAVTESLVKKGDRVLKGQKIAQKENALSACIHAPASGEVLDIKAHIHPFGNKVPSIFLKSDGKDEAVFLKKNTSLDALSAQDIIQAVKDAGIVGMGGAAFPTHIKLMPPKDKKIDTLIINAVECEPYLTADYRLMLEEHQKIISGIKALMKALSVVKACVVIEDNKPRAIEAMEKALAEQSSIQLMMVKTKYPQGSEKQLIEVVTARRVPMGKLPLDIGVVVHNVSTAKAVYDAVFEGRALTERVVTVSGSNIKEPANVKVRLGTRIGDLLEFCGGPLEEINKIIQGGPMMGLAAASIEVPVIKGTTGILLFKKNEITYDQSGPCIRCGRCIKACPMGLAPARFMEFAEVSEFSETLSENIMNCMECGSCAYACPSRRPLVHWIKVAKSQLNKQKRSK